MWRNAQGEAKNTFAGVSIPGVHVENSLQRKIKVFEGQIATPRGNTRRPAARGRPSAGRRTRDRAVAISRVMLPRLLASRAALRWAFFTRLTQRRTPTTADLADVYASPFGRTTLAAIRTVLLACLVVVGMSVSDSEPASIRPRDTFIMSADPPARGGWAAAFTDSRRASCRGRTP